MITPTLLVFAALASFGLAYIVGHSMISLPLRMLIDPGDIETPKAALRGFFLMLIECPACFGFWEGLTLGALFNIYVGNVVIGEIMISPWIFVPAFGFFISGTNFLLGVLTGLISDPRHPAMYPPEPSSPAERSKSDE